MKDQEYYESLDKRTKEYKDWKASKGLGDTIEKVTKATGIKKAVELFSKATGIDCGCDERKEKLNKLFSYGTKPKCLTEDQYNNWKSFKAKEGKTLPKEDRELIANIYSEVFQKKYFEPCTCSPRAWLTMIQQIDKVYSTYEV